MDWVRAIENGLITVGLFIIFGLFFMLAFTRPIVKRIVGRFTKRLMSDTYKDNIMEVVTAATRVGLITIMENNLRAHSGSIIERPFGSPRKFLGFDGLVFSPAQLFRLPAYGDEPVDMRTVIGPAADKPLVIDTPLLSAALGFAVAVNSKVKRAIAKATAACGTATNAGQGAFLPDERMLAKHMILQYMPGHWSKSPDILRQADAIEIYIGQGASAASTKVIAPKDLPGEARDMLGLYPDEELVVSARFADMHGPGDLKAMVDMLREMTEGVPIGVKICPGGELEEDLEIAIRAGVDFISLDGGQAGTKGSAPILEDDFALPTVYALSRAVQYMKQTDARHSVSLLVGGGFNTPGECLKALALGADAVYMGTAFLWAMTHEQVTKTMPWEPPTHLVFYSGKAEHKFDEDEAARCLENFIKSCTEEMTEAVRCLGKRSLREVDAGDLVALDEWTSDVTKVRLAYGKVKASP